MLFDTHMHSSWSGDSEADPSEMIQKAKALGLPGLTFTDHLDWDFPTMPHAFDLDIENYFPSMKKLSDEIQDASFTVFTGIELGLQPHLKEEHNKLLKQYHPDFVIGSIHQLDREDPYFDNYWENRSYDTVYKHYFAATLENLNAFHDIDSLGHLDYITRYGQRVAASRNDPKTGAVLRYDDYKEMIDEILLFLIHHDIAMEINTAPLRYNLPEPNPSFQIIKRYHDIGGKLITVGADAHKPSDIAMGFSALPSQLKDCGFTSYYVYQNRIPTEYPL